MSSQSVTKKYLIILPGGIGKNVLATSVIAGLKAQKPGAGIIIATAYPFIWQNNPDIEQAVDINKSQNLYKQIASEEERESWTVFAHDPYLTEDFIYKNKHLADIWCDLLGIKPVPHEPKLFIGEEEKEAVKKKLPVTDKPLFFIQTNGGAGMQKFPISWARDLPLSIAQEVVDKMREKNYEVIHLRRRNQPALNNTLWINVNARELAPLLTFSDKRLFIDSYPQHAAAALNLPSVVTWVTNSPDIFGYEIHENIITNSKPSFRHNPDAYLEEYDITGAIEQSPFDTDKIFDVGKILDSLLEEGN